MGKGNSVGENLPKSGERKWVKNEDKKERELGKPKPPRNENIKLFKENPL